MRTAHLIALLALVGLSGPAFAAADRPSSSDAPVPAIESTAAASSVSPGETEAQGGPSSDAEARDAQLRASQRESVAFDTWAGKVRLPGKKVTEPPFTPASFRQWSESVAEDRDGDFSFYDWRTGAGSNVMVSMRACPTPQQAADALMVFMFHTSTMLMPTERITDGGYLRGDASFLLRLGPPSDQPGFIRGLAFVRNNVAVMVTLLDPEPLAALVELVDQALVGALVDTSDPAYSQKLNEPASGASTESEVQEGRNNVAEARHEQISALQRQRVEFDAWAGKVKLPGKKIAQSPLTPASFRQWSKSVAEDRHGDFSFYMWRTGAGGDVRVSMNVCPTPQRAADALMVFMFDTIAGAMQTETVTDGGYLRGDASFLLRVGLPGKAPGPVCGLAFVRSNVALMLTLSDPEPLDALSDFVDKTLIEALVPTSDPAFSHELTEGR